MILLWYFLAGLFAFNSIPHLVKGIIGQTHMTPFKRVSSPILNVIYAFINIIFALFILGLATRTGGLVMPWAANITSTNLWVFLAGGLFISLADANLFSNPNASLPWHRD